MHWLYEVQGGKGKNSGQEGQTRDWQATDWTHGLGVISGDFVYCMFGMIEFVIHLKKCNWVEYWN